MNNNLEAVVGVILVLFLAVSVVGGIVGVFLALT